MPEPLEKTMSSIMGQTKGLYEPMLKFNTLLVSNLEKMSELASWSDERFIEVFSPASVH